jgi:hypothetical protein
MCLTKGIIFENNISAGINFIFKFDINLLMIFQSAYYEKIFHTTRSGLHGIARILVFQCAV